jgi:hypothetical protein
MPRPESNTYVTQGGFVPTQRTPESVISSILTVAESLNFTSLSTPDEPGFTKYGAAALGINPDIIRQAAEEFGGLEDESELDSAVSRKYRLLESIGDTAIGFPHETFSADLVKQSAILHDYPATQELLERLTDFVQTTMAARPEFAPHGGKHAGLASWKPAAVRIDRYKVASDHEGGRSAIHSFPTNHFEKPSDRDRVLTARITLEGEQQLNVVSDGGTILRGVHVAASQVLLSREVGLISGDDVIRGPHVAMRTPSDQLTLTVFNR